MARRRRRFFDTPCARARPQSGNIAVQNLWERLVRRQQSAFQQGSDVLPARPVNVRFVFYARDSQSINNDLFRFNFNDLDGAG